MQDLGVHLVANPRGFLPTRKGQHYLSSGKLRQNNLAGSHVSQPKSILMIKAALNCKAVGEEREAWEKLPVLFELKASPICLTLLPKGRSLWGRLSGEH